MAVPRGDHHALGDALRRDRGRPGGKSCRGLGVCSGTLRLRILRPRALSVVAMQGGLRVLLADLRGRVGPMSGEHLGLAVRDHIGRRSGVALRAGAPSVVAAGDDLHLLTLAVHLSDLHGPPDAVLRLALRRPHGKRGRGGVEPEPVDEIVGDVAEAEAQQGRRRNDLGHHPVEVDRDLASGIVPGAPLLAAAILALPDDGGRLAITRVQGMDLACHRVQLSVRGGGRPYSPSRNGPEVALWLLVRIAAQIVPANSVASGHREQQEQRRGLKHEQLHRNCDRQTLSTVEKGKRIVEHK
mmetsp:Transcript_133172/g.385278  ORF Transcript_133172/g.385278 Transcript_133172/m.385278 type:complete len:298 (-) Transcript_133172:24-917(-)